MSTTSSAASASGGFRWALAVPSVFIFPFFFFLFLNRQTIYLIKLLPSIVWNFWYFTFNLTIINWIVSPADRKSCSSPIPIPVAVDIKRSCHSYLYVFVFVSGVGVCGCGCGCIYEFAGLRAAIKCHSDLKAACHREPENILTFYSESYIALDPTQSCCCAENFSLR